MQPIKQIFRALFFIYRYIHEHNSFSCYGKNTREEMRNTWGILSIASAANDDVTVCVFVGCGHCTITKAGTFVGALYTVGLTFCILSLCSL